MHAEGQGRGVHSKSPVSDILGAEDKTKTQPPHCEIQPQKNTKCQICMIYPLAYKQSSKENIVLTDDVFSI